MASTFAGLPLSPFCSVQFFFFFFFLRVFSSVYSAHRSVPSAAGDPTGPEQGGQHLHTVPADVFTLHMFSLSVSLRLNGKIFSPLVPISLV
jgi:hypothetical protein